MFCLLIVTVLVKMPVSNSLYKHVKESEIPRNDVTLCVLESSVNHIPRSFLARTSVSNHSWGLLYFTYPYFNRFQEYNTYKFM